MKPLCWTLSSDVNVQPSQHKEIIMHLAKLVDTIAVAMARASILWLIGEYSDRVPKIAPDVLRKMAKIFVDEVIRDISTRVCAFVDKSSISG